MTPLEAVASIAPGTGAPAITRLGATITPAAVSQPGFADMLQSGLKAVEAKVAAADSMVQQFAIGDSVPLHQVTFALEEARLSVELAMQVRNRLVESYRDLMGMQL